MIVENLQLRSGGNTELRDKFGRSQRLTTFFTDGGGCLAVVRRLVVFDSDRREVRSSVDDEKNVARREEKEIDGERETLGERVGGRERLWERERDEGEEGREEFEKMIKTTVEG
ncbi:hypothetical protein L484_028001 [Morus notabilis]|uniref:Uncharacterized protein n=1 Tax=Morus notabilis TaxID=981085 RepID=W9SW74_9ROSA|nr:hypothetical protein L484_028001 [Morus notabilis]